MSDGKKNCRFRAWCFTLNNPAETDATWLNELKVDYLVYGHEIAPTTGTPHYQGYVYFPNGKTSSAAKKCMPGCHIEVAKGTAKQNRDYCTKECGEVVERGAMPSQGERGDLMEVKELVDKGGKILDCFESQFATTVKYTKAIEYYIALKTPPRTDAPEVFWRWGGTGVGKTRWAFDTYGIENVFKKPCKKEWFNGYMGQQVCLIDDFDAETMYNKEFLQLLDRYPMKVQVKNGYVEFNSPIIVITCDSPPDRFWSGKDLEQVLRRLTHLVEVSAQ